MGKLRSAVSSWIVGQKGERARNGGRGKRRVESWWAETPHFTPVKGRGTIFFSFILSSLVGSSLSIMHLFFGFFLKILGP